MRKQVQYFPLQNRGKKDKYKYIHTHIHTCIHVYKYNAQDNHYFINIHFIRWHGFDIKNT